MICVDLALPHTMKRDGSPAHARSSAHRGRSSPTVRWSASLVAIASGQPCAAASSWCTAAPTRTPLDALFTPGWSR
jgi:hypothetical protein